MLKQLSQIDKAQIVRYSSGMSGFDRMLGETTLEDGSKTRGFVAGEILFLAGVPGAGKSTLLLQLAKNFSVDGKKVLYVSGEENLPQMKLRAERVGANGDNIICLDDSKLDEIYDSIQQVDPALIIVDSLQMVHSDNIRGAPGTPSQMKQSFEYLRQQVKAENRIMVVVGQATKAGMVAGVLAIQHMADAVFFMTIEEDGSRLIFSHKNRFGVAQMEWKVKMTPKGIIDADCRVEIEDDFTPTSMGSEVVIPYEKIKPLLDNSWVNRVTVNSDVAWLYEKIFGKKEQFSEFSITCKVKEG